MLCHSTTYIYNVLRVLKAWMNPQSYFLQKNIMKTLYKTFPTCLLIALQYFQYFDFSIALSADSKKHKNKLVMVTWRNLTEMFKRSSKNTKQLFFRALQIKLYESNDIKSSRSTTSTCIPHFLMTIISHEIFPIFWILTMHRNIHAPRFKDNNR